MKLVRVVAICLLIPIQLVVNLQPASAAPVYVFPVAGCTVKYTHSHHDYPATDIQAKKGCAFVAPINGVVDEAHQHKNGHQVDEQPKSNLRSKF